MCIFYHLSLLSSLIVCVANIITLIHQFTCFKSRTSCCWITQLQVPQFMNFINWIWYLHFTLLLILLVNVQHWCHEKLLLMVRFMVLEAISLLSSVERMSSLSVYVTYSGIWNVNSWFFCVWFEWSVVYHIFFRMSSVFLYLSWWRLSLLLYMDWCVFYVVHCMHS
jgi:hypothetical protein